jgi:hypothetical protein
VALARFRRLCRASPSSVIPHQAHTSFRKIPALQESPGALQGTGDSAVPQARRAPPGIRRRKLIQSLRPAASFPGPPRLSFRAPPGREPAVPARRRLCGGRANGLIRPTLSPCSLHGRLMQAPCVCRLRLPEILFRPRLAVLQVCLMVPVRPGCFPRSAFLSE